MTEQEAVLVLSPADAPYRTASSTLVTAGCGHPAWLSVGGAQTLLDHVGPIRTVCERCVPEGELDMRMSPHVQAELDQLGMDRFSQARIQRLFGKGERP